MTVQLAVILVANSSEGLSELTYSQRDSLLLLMLGLVLVLISFLVEGMTQMAHGESQEEEPIAPISHAKAACVNAGDEQE